MRILYRADFLPASHRDQEKAVRLQQLQGGPSLAQFEAHDQQKVNAHRENLGRLAAGCLKYNTPELQRLFDSALIETDFPTSRKFEHFALLFFTPCS